ncbi:MAG: UDP-2,4-diacetamido-2,4,6-trideoxy-beta-L-altropyranose hydrolase [Pseudomonadota bacterium]|nr:UDP-2,4-diacetamido-2,4,6-trideoxy-beta-L-altropyranose hydrolase [Pseudomonadota bacterium]
MKIAIRVDASSDIGTGHVRRCLSLACALKQSGAQLRFVTRDLGLDAVALIRNAGFGDVVQLPSPETSADNYDEAVPHAAWARVSQSQDAAETAAALADFAPETVILDSYAFDARWHEAVADALGSAIALVDDLADRQLSADYVIDHTYSPDHRAKYSSVLSKPAKILGGPHFGLLGPAYADAPRYDFNETVRSVGVFLGGVDAQGHSALMLEALSQSGFAGQVEVVTTSANPHLTALQDAVANRPNTILSTDLPDLAAFFARHDLQIGAGGGASWERCCIGVPTLLVVVAENQHSVAPLLAREGVADYAPDLSIETLSAKIAQLVNDAPKRCAMAEKSRELVDGLGATRVAIALTKTRLRLRTASLEDARLMFVWRGHRATRAVSRETGELDWDAHVRWLEAVLADGNRQLFVSEIGDRPVGVIRLDGNGSRRAEVSLYLDPALHGLGLGPHLLLAGEDKAGFEVIDATVLDGNLASQRLFAKCGYHQTGPESWRKMRGAAMHRDGLSSMNSPE